MKCFGKKAKVSFIRKNKGLKQSKREKQAKESPCSPEVYFFKNAEIQENLIVFKTSFKIHRFQLFRLGSYTCWSKRDAGLFVAEIFPQLSVLGRGTRQRLEAFSDVTVQGQILLASSGWRPGMLLNLLQCTGHPLPQHRTVWPHVSVVLRLRLPL